MLPRKKRHTFHNEHHGKRQSLLLPTMAELRSISSWRKHKFFQREECKKVYNRLFISENKWWCNLQRKHHQITFPSKSPWRQSKRPPTQDYLHLERPCGDDSFTLEIHSQLELEWRAQNQDRYGACIHKAIWPITKISKIQLQRLFWALGGTYARRTVTMQEESQSALHFLQRTSHKPYIYNRKSLPWFKHQASPKTTNSKQKREHDQRRERWPQQRRHGKTPRFLRWESRRLPRT